MVRYIRKQGMSEFTEKDLEDMQARIAEGAHHLRNGIRKAFGDRYSKEVDNRIALVRKVMQRTGKSPIWCAYEIMQKGDAEQKRDPLFVCAAVEIAEEQDAPVALN